jgi:ABC-2 type transport system ATP-binding protein
VSELAQEDKEINFLYRGHLDEVTKVLAKLDLTNLEVTEPDLEEIFLHYYK